MVASLRKASARKRKRSTAMKSPHRGPEASTSTQIVEESNCSSEDCAPSPVVSVAEVFGNQHLLRLVLAQLSLQDLCRASSVCKDWLTVCNSDEFWRKVSLQGRVCRPEQVVAVLQRHSGIEHLDLGQIQLDLAGGSPLLRGVGAQTRLQHLQVGASTLSAGGLDRLLTAAPLLQRFQASGSTFQLVVSPHVDSAEAMFQHARLQELQLADCSLSGATFDCPSLSSLSLAYCPLTSIRCGNLPDLHRLDLKECGKLPESSLRTFLCQVSQLRSLDLSGVPSARTEVLLEVAPCLRSLQAFTAHSCANLALTALSSLVSLTFLDLSHSSQLTSTAGVPAVGAWATLRELVLDECKGLREVTLSLPCLHTISLQSCRALRSVQLAAPLLQTLRLGSSQYPGVPHLTSLDLASACLTQASWRNLPYLHSLQLACSGLTSLHLACCDALPDRALQNLTPSPLHAGCPNLQVLHLEVCEQLCNPTLDLRQLAQLTVSSCPVLQGLTLHTPRLQGLYVEECKQLTRLALQSIDMDSVALGGCPSLNQLTLRCPNLQMLDLQGCGDLEMVQGSCPRLHMVDAQFCHVLGNQALDSMAACMPTLQSLLLPYCTAIACTGLAALAAMQGLHTLDLSFSKLKDIGPLFTACPSLRTLKLQGCRQLAPTALQPLSRHLPAGGCPQAQGHQVLPQLQVLDVSYCPLPCQELAALMLHATQLQDLAISGCAGATDELFASVNQSRRAVQLHTLSAKHLKGLQACWLGLQPLDASQALPDSARASWHPAASAFSGLQTLRLGLSGLQTLALGLPNLTSLDLHGCHELRSLVLDCPGLLSLSCQACRALEEQILEEALAGCPKLKSADLLHSQAAPSQVTRLSQRGASLKAAAS